MNRGRFVNHARRDDIGWTSGLHRRAAPKGAAHQVAEIMRCRCRWNVHEQCPREKYDHNRVSEEVAEVTSSSRRSEEGGFCSNRRSPRSDGMMTPKRQNRRLPVLPLRQRHQERAGIQRRRPWPGARSGSSSCTCAGTRAGAEGRARCVLVDANVGSVEYADGQA